VRPGIAGSSVDHLRDGRGRRHGCRGRGREEVSADFQKRRPARACRPLVTGRRTDAAVTVVRLQPEKGEFLAGTVRTARVLAHQERSVSTTAHPSTVDRLAGGRRTATAARAQTEPVHVGRLRHAAAARRPSATVPAAAAAAAAESLVVTVVAVAVTTASALPTVRQRVR